MFAQSGMLQSSMLNTMQWSKSTCTGPLAKCPLAKPCHAFYRKAYSQKRCSNGIEAGKGPAAVAAAATAASAVAHSTAPKVPKGGDVHLEKISVSIAKKEY